MTKPDVDEDPLAEYVRRASQLLAEASAAFHSIPPDERREVVFSDAVSPLLAELHAAEKKVRKSLIKLRTVAFAIAHAARVEGERQRAERARPKSVKERVGG